MQLTREQRQALDNGEPVPVVVDHMECVMIRRDVYQRVQNSVELNHEELRSVFARSFESSDWNDPAMDVYDNYDAHKK